MARTETGFTLLEMVVVIAITGILGGIVAVFVSGPVQAYVATARRADMVDTANASLRRMARDIRASVPNSIRIQASTTDAGCSAIAPCSYLEFLPASAGGRYRASGGGDILDTASADSTFDVLGPPVSLNAGDQLVVYNLGIAGADAYAGNSTATHVRLAVSTAQAGATNIAIGSPHALPLDSPSARFQVIPAAELAVTYACRGVGTSGGNGTGTLVRYAGYGINSSWTLPTGTPALLADNVSACAMSYTPGVSQRDGVVSAVLQLTRADETVALRFEIHVNNVP